MNDKKSFDIKKEIKEMEDLLKVVNNNKNSDSAETIMKKQDGYLPTSEDKKIFYEDCMKIIESGFNNSFTEEGVKNILSRIIYDSILTNEDSIGVKLKKTQWYKNSVTTALTDNFINITKDLEEHDEINLIAEKYRKYATRPGLIHVELNKNPKDEITTVTKDMTEVYVFTMIEKYKGKDKEYEELIKWGKML